MTAKEIRPAVVTRRAFLCKGVKMGDWNERAAKLQRQIISDEMRTTEEYDDEQIRQAIVHARQDIVLLVSHLSYINSQLSMIKGTLISIFWIALASALHFIFHWF